MPAPAGRDALRIHAGTRAETPGLARRARGRASGDAGSVPVPSRSTAASGVSRPRAGTARSGAPTPGTVSPRGREERAACDEDVGEAQAGRGDRGAGQSSSGRGRRTRGWRAGRKGPGRRPRLSCGGRQSARLSTWSHEWRLASEIYQLGASSVKKINLVPVWRRTVGEEVWRRGQFLCHTHTHRAFITHDVQST